MEVEANISFFELIPDVIGHHHKVIPIHPDHGQTRIQKPNLIDLVRYLHIKLRVMLLKAVVELRHVEWIKKVVHPWSHAPFVMFHKRPHFFCRQKNRKAVLLS
jgi:hypothetical protein